MFRSLSYNIFKSHLSLEARDELPAQNPPSNLSEYIQPKTPEKNQIAMLNRYENKGKTKIIVQHIAPPGHPIGDPIFPPAIPTT